MKAPWTQSGSEAALVLEPCRACISPCATSAPFSSDPTQATQAARGLPLDFMKTVYWRSIDFFPPPPMPPSPAPPSPPTLIKFEQPKGGRGDSLTDGQLAASIVVPIVGEWI